MKTNIITLVVLVLFSTSSVNAFCKGNSQLYKNVIVNEETNTKTTEVYKGKNGMNLIPLQKYVIKLNKNNHPYEKVIYKWVEAKGWQVNKKYKYICSLEGDIEALSYDVWNEGENGWINIQNSTFIKGEEMITVLETK